MPPYSDPAITSSSGASYSFDEPTDDRSTKKTAHLVRTRRRAVAFAPLDAFVLIEARSDLPKEEKKSRWYSKEELKNIKEKDQQALIALRSGKLSDDEEDCDEWCIRGLDHLRTAKSHKVRRTLRQSVVRAVLEEQDRQRITGCFDTTRISEEAAEASDGAAERALRFGAADALEAGRGFRRSELRRSNAMRQPPPERIGFADDYLSPLQNELRGGWLSACNNRSSVSTHSPKLRFPGGAHLPERRSSWFKFTLKKTNSH